MVTVKRTRRSSGDLSHASMKFSHLSSWTRALPFYDWWIAFWWGIDFVHVYLDDVLTFSTSFGELFVHLQTVLSKIAAHTLELKIFKCSYARPSVALAGHVVHCKGIHVHPENGEAISELEKMRAQTQLRSFLALCGYYHTIIKDFASKSDVLYTATSVKRKVFQ